MIPKNDSYFSPELVEGGHYIVTGLLDENYIDDLYQIVDVTQILHRELINNDFDIVLFYDYINHLYCFDARSMRLINNINNNESEQTSEKTNVSIWDKIRCSGPSGGAAFEHENDETENVNNLDSNNLRFMSFPMAWEHVVALLKQTRYRTAIVFSNITGLVFGFPEGALQALTELNSAVTDRPHAAFYIFRSANGAVFSEYNDQAFPVWKMFYQQILRPLFETCDPNQNRVITLSTPNAAEVAHLLNMMRLRRERTLYIDMMEFKKIVEEVAYACATNNKSLRALKVSLEEYINRNPCATLTLSNYQSAIGVKREKTALEEINSLIGLKNVKSWISEWTSSRKRDGFGREFPKSASRFYPNVKTNVKNGLALNIVFTGKPGTGKSTLAKQIGRLYYELGLLPRGHLVECSASNIVSPYVGGSAPLVRQRVMEAMGGVLMIDEAYAITRNEHGKEAIDQLVNEMTQYAGQFAVVICGYESPMKKFLAANQGLSSRFATTLHLEDYTADEMEQIFRKFLSEEDSTGLTARLGENLESKFDAFCDNWANDHDNKWGNAREAATLVQNMKRRALARISDSGLDIINNELVLTEEDIPSEIKKHLKAKPRNPVEIINELEHETIGLYNVRERLIRIAQNISWQVGKVTPGRYIFHGPPGTGKTHMARLFCNLLFRLNIIKRNFVYEVSAKQLCHPDPEFDYGLDNGRQPTLSEILEAVFDNAKGGVLFIDEAPQLMDDDLGNSVLRALVPIIDRPDVYENTCVVLAGYTDKISCLLSQDDGLNRRFPLGNRIRFDNYNATDLAKLSVHFASKYGHTVDDEGGFFNRTCMAFAKYLENPDPNFGNAGFIRDTYIPQAIEVKSARLSQMEIGDEKALATEDDVKGVMLPTRSRLTAYDIPEPFNTFAGPIGIPFMPEKNVWEKVSELVGKEEIKDYLMSRKNDKKRLKFCDDVQARESHFAIIGPSGSGRHTAARVISAVLKELGVIDRDEVLVTGKGSFEAQFVGQTVPKTSGVIEKAKGGCMLVEYPSNMLSKGQNDNTFGLEALGVINGAMSGSSEKLSVIFIDDEEGFKKLSEQMPSVVSNFSRVFHIEDLLPGEMYDLFVKKIKYSFVFHDEIRDLLPDFFINWVSRRGDLNENAAVWSGGNEVDKLITDIKNNWENLNGKTDNSTQVPLRRITREMFPEKLQKYLVAASADKNKALAQLNELTGLDGVKKAVSAIERRIRSFDKKAVPGFYAFVGDPGSGKTMVAKLFGGILRGTEVLSQGHVVVRTAKQLAMDPSSFEKCLKLAKNGVFFIDEAPQLAETTAGYEVVKKLLTTIEDADIMKNVCIILAGYEDAMNRLISLDAGLSSRFEKQNSIIKFENYTAEQMLSIMDDFAQKADTDPYLNLPYKLDVTDEKFRNASKKIFDVIRKTPNFGNGRFVRNYIDACVNGLLERVDGMDAKVDKKDKKLLSTLTYQDIPDKYLSMAKKETKPAEVSLSKINTAFFGAINDDNLDEYVEKIKRSTVLVLVTDSDGNESSGTGFIITEEGHVLTCNHVLKGAKDVKVKVYTPGSIGGDYHMFDCEVLEPGYEGFDMALGKIQGNNFEPLPIRPLAEGINDNEKVLMVGFPLGGILNGDNLNTLNANKFQGEISSYQRIQEDSYYLDLFYVDIEGMPGCSGSAVISKEDGRVIGVFPGAKGDDPDKKKAKYYMKFFYPITYFWSAFVDFEGEDIYE